jgi:hypothetical protein
VSDVCYPSLILRFPEYYGGPLHWGRLRAVGLFNLLETNDADGLSKRIIWDSKTGGVFYHPQEGDIGKKRLIASPDGNPRIWSLFEPKDLFGPARLVLARFVNGPLKVNASPQLRWNDDASELFLRLMPKNLLGAMWLQFAEAIDQRKKIARCEICGSWFDQFRKDKRHCSDKCRVRASRQRKERNNER